MAVDADVVVVGSGFGGAVVAARLAGAGYRVIVLERGRRWTVDDFPRELDDAWVYDAAHPESRHGWFDFRVFPHMTVVQGAGVGGGSLVYANILVDAADETFAGGWPPEITADVMRPHYATVKRMMGAAPVPPSQWPARTKLLREAAVASGFGDRFMPLDLAVTFDEAWHYGLPDAHGVHHSRTVHNAQGVEQGTCVHLGTCDIGCRVKARNTLDYNYLAQAEQQHADVRPLHLVTGLAPVGEGYEVSFDRLEGGVRHPGRVRARLVVLAAGSLGSTEILLRAAREQGTLPGVSARLGHGWSSNGDFLTPAFHPFRRVTPTRGPTITAAIDLLDGVHRGAPIFIEDGGFPDAARDWAEAASTREPDDERERALVESVRLLARLNAFDRIMPWFAQACDAADGTLSLRHGKLWLDWDVTASEDTIDAVVSMHERLARATQGIAMPPLTWTLTRDLITPHPLGGANMASDPSRGVVGPGGEVFGCPNLYVADGAIVPKAIGRNPSKTIAALAEHIAAGIIAEGR